MCFLCYDRRSIYAKHSHLLTWKNDFDALMVVDADLEKLYRLFQDIDKDGSGEIDLVELIHYLRLERTKFNKRVFTIFDEDGSGEIDFREFVVALWNYCTMGKSALTIFAFDLYDTDGSGEIELDEVERMLKEVYGKAFKTSRVAQQLLNKITVHCHLDTGGAISVERFNHFCTAHPGLIFPAFRFQIELQEKMCGKQFWKRAAATRVKLSNGANLTVQQLLMAHVSESAFNEVTRHDSKSAQKGRQKKGTVGKMVEQMQSAHQNDVGRVRRGTVLDAIGVTTDALHVLDPQSGRVDPRLQAQSFRDFAMNTGTVADRRARRGFDGSAKAKLQAVAAFSKAGRVSSEKKKTNKYAVAAQKLRARSGSGKNKSAMLLKKASGQLKKKKASGGLAGGGGPQRSGSGALKKRLGGGGGGGVAGKLKAASAAARKKRMMDAARGK